MSQMNYDNIYQKLNRLRLSMDGDNTLYHATHRNITRGNVTEWMRMLHIAIVNNTNPDLPWKDTNWQEVMLTCNEVYRNINDKWMDGLK